MGGRTLPAALAKVRDVLSVVVIGRGSLEHVTHVLRPHLLLHRLVPATAHRRERRRLVLRLHPSSSSSSPLRLFLWPLLRPPLHVRLQQTEAVVRQLQSEVVPDRGQRLRVALGGHFDQPLALRRLIHEDLRKLEGNLDVVLVDRRLLAVRGDGARRLEHATRRHVRDLQQLCDDSRLVLGHSGVPQQLLHARDVRRAARA
ncbi:hypothetical protein PMAYCL1PPCAC_10083 [Pristionchus mayeri]|uniref:Uncharacterized protein n=1 Tax=Pristionchus mayeri TaxID=1317129 RepID=A0AAN5C733_9BILA|nr:hypothetical protein PMAYCL1PPCAC_10083 [Pristionchus mayeri]